MDVVNRCFEELKTDCNRVMMNIKVDYRKEADHRMDGKVESVKKNLQTLSDQKR